MSKSPVIASPVDGVYDVLFIKDIFVHVLLRAVVHRGRSPQGASLNFHGSARPYAPYTWKVWSMNLPINTFVFTEKSGVL